MQKTESEIAYLKVKLVFPDAYSRHNEHFDKYEVVAGYGSFDNVIGQNYGHGDAWIDAARQVPDLTDPDYLKWRLKQNNYDLAAALISKAEKKERDAKATDEHRSAVLRFTDLLS